MRGHGWRNLSDMIGVSEPRSLAILSSPYATTTMSVLELMEYLNASRTSSRVMVWHGAIGRHLQPQCARVILTLGILFFICRARSFSSLLRNPSGDSLLNSTSSRALRLSSFLFKRASWRALWVSLKASWATLALAESALVFACKARTQQINA